MKNKYELIDMTLVNWQTCSYCPCISLEGNTLLAGNTGAGKSTLIDALLATLFKEFTNFNKAANANGHRDLKSYVRCKVNENDDNGGKKVYSREGRVIAYTAITVRLKDNSYAVIGNYYNSPSDTANIERKYFFIKNTKNEDIKYCSSDNVPKDFMDFKSQFSRYNFTWNSTISEAVAFIANNLGFVGREEDFKKMEQGIVDAISLTVSDITDVTKYCRTKLLPTRNTNIDSMMMYSAEAETALNEMNIYTNRANSADEIDSSIQKMADIHKQVKSAHIFMNLSKKKIADIELINKNDELQSNRIEKDELVDKKQKLEDELIDCNADLKELQNNPNNTELINAQKAKQNAESRFRQAEYRYNQIKNHINNLKKKATHYNDDTLIELSGFDIDKLNENYKQEYLNKCKNVENGYSDKCSDYRNLKRDKYDQKEHIDEDIQDMNKGIFVHDKNYKEALSIINNEFKQNNINDEAKMLYEHLSMKKGYESWQAPLETYLGRTRFNIVVKPENFAFARKIVCQKRLHNICLLDTTELNDNFNSENLNLCSLLDFDEKYIQLLMQEKYGRCLAVPTCDTDGLNKHGVYMGKDGTRYSLRAFSNVDITSRLYIGMKAREDLKHRKQEERAQIIKEIAELDDAINHERDKYNIVETVKNALSVCNVSEFDEYKTLPDTIAELNKKIDNLSNNEISLEIVRLNDKIAKIKKERKEYDNRISEKDITIGTINSKIENIENDISNIQNNIETYKTKYPDIFTEVRVEFDNDNDFRTTNRHLENKIHSMEKKFNNLNTNLIMQERDYANQYNQELPFNGFDDKDIYIKEHENFPLSRIVELRQKYIESNNRYKNRMVQQYIVDMNSGIAYAQAIRNNINKILKTIPCGRKRYTFDKIKAAPGQEDMYNLFMRERKDDNDITDEEVELVKSKLAENKEMYSDYRNIISLDMNVEEMRGDKTITRKLSDIIGTSSGGETQIPFYILNAITLLNNGGYDANTLKINILDEAFDKMDRASIGSIMNFYNQLGFQSIIAVPDSKNEIISEFVDNCVVVINNEIGRAYENIGPNRKVLEISNLKEAV